MSQILAVDKRNALDALINEKLKEVSTLRRMLASGTNDSTVHIRLVLLEREVDRYIDQLVDCPL